MKCYTYISTTLQFNDFVYLYDLSPAASSAMSIIQTKECCLKFFCHSKFLYSITKTIRNFDYSETQKRYAKNSISQ